MKLIIKQYLASLKERDELDEMLPDLLSQMGLNVFSRPRRGTRQYGVDVAAVGSIDDGPEKVYLFSVKLGDLTRASWDGDSIQSLRPSLNEIKDVYIPTCLPHEHRGKDAVVCLCFGGDIQEEVRLGVEGYIQQNSGEGLSFEEWNGDKLAELIQLHFLREDLLPPESRPMLRKSLALIDEPEASFKHFSALIKTLTEIQSSDPWIQLRTIRQINVCLWILFAWCRDAGNLESAYLSGERALLCSWSLTKMYLEKKTKVARLIRQSFDSILIVYQSICRCYIEKIMPHTARRHGLSFAVQSSYKLDVNLKLFDVLGRLAMAGLWSCWHASICDKADKESMRSCEQEIHVIAESLKQLIYNNPTLLLPFKDEQSIDISLALLFLSHIRGNEDYLKDWLSKLINRAIFAYKTHGPYPCILESYRELLEHPSRGDNEYRKEVTSASVLYPTIALWAAILGHNDVFEKVKNFKQSDLEHCNFQFWYPDDTSEDHFYTNNDLHGATLSGVRVDISSNDFLEFVWNECNCNDFFQRLSAYHYNLWPLFLVGCRHYRLPIPLHFTLGFKEGNNLSS